MNPAQILLLLIIAWCVGFLWLGIKQGISTTHAPIIVQATNVVEPTIPVPQTNINNTDEVYIPWETKTPTLLEKTHTFAFQNGITSYANMNDFKAQEPLSREWAAKMFTQFAKLIYKENYFKQLQWDSNCLFQDKDAIEKSLYRDVIEACSMGFMKAVDGYFAPKTRLSHNQANIILARITQLDISTGSNLPITRWGLIESMLDHYMLWINKKN